MIPGSFVSNLSPEGPLSCIEMYSNSNYTHLNQQIKIYENVRNFQASVFVVGRNQNLQDVGPPGAGLDTFALNVIDC